MIIELGHLILISCVVVAANGVFASLFK